MRDHTDLALVQENNPEGRSAQPAAINSTPDATPKLDVAALLREALTVQQPGEDIEAVLRRVLPGEDMICKVIAEFLAMQEWRFGISRQQAARQLADADTRLMITPDGKPYLEALVLNLSGLEALPEDVRTAALQQIKDHFRAGKTGPIVLGSGQRAAQSGRVVAMSFLVILLLILAFLWGLLR
jgi:hypothetical protein